MVLVLLVLAVLIMLVQNVFNAIQDIILELMMSVLLIDALVRMAMVRLVLFANKMAIVNAPNAMLVII